MDRHRLEFDADLNPYFHFDADTDPDPARVWNSIYTMPEHMRIADPTPSFTHVRKSDFFLTFTEVASQHWFIPFVNVVGLLGVVDTDPDPAVPDRYTPVTDPDPANDANLTRSGPTTLVF